MAHKTFTVRILWLVLTMIILGCDKQERIRLIEEYKKVESEHNNLWSTHYNQLRENVITFKLIDYNTSTRELLFQCKSSSPMGINGSVGDIKIINQFNRVLYSFKYENSSYIPPNGEPIEVIFQGFCNFQGYDYNDLSCITRTQLVKFEDGKSDGYANGYSYELLTDDLKLSYTMSDYYLEKYSLETIQRFTQSLQKQNDGYKNLLRKYYNF